MDTITDKIRFSVQPRGGRRSSQRKGQVRISDEDVCLVTSSRKLFKRPVEARQVIARSQIFDARAEGNRLLFDVHGADGIQQVVLTTFRGSVARRLLHALPTQMTPARAAEQEALASYSERIVALTPVTWVTYVLIGINVLVFLAMCAAGVGVMSPNAAMTVSWGTNFGPYTLSGQWWRLMTSVFIHFGLFHLLLNMITLYQVGRLAERLFGSGRLLGLYLFAGFTGSLVSITWHPSVNSAGASGAIFGVFGALLAFVLRFRRELPASLAKQQRTMILALIGYNLFYGFTQQHSIDNGAHLGGLVGGLLMGWTLSRPLSEPARSLNARSSIAVSCALALMVLGASAYRLMSVRETHRQELQFDSLVRALGPEAAKASKEGVALLHSPTATQGERDQVIRRIEQEVVPQWEALHAGFEGVHLEQGSVHGSLRAAILKYLDDNQKIYQLAVVSLGKGSEVDAATEAQFKGLTDDLLAQAAEIKKLSAGQ